MKTFAYINGMCGSDHARFFTATNLQEALAQALDFAQSKPATLELLDATNHYKVMQTWHLNDKPEHIGPNHAPGCLNIHFYHSGKGYNRVRVCYCGAEDHDPE